jgi:hypothetical protein
MITIIVTFAIAFGPYNGFLPMSRQWIDISQQAKVETRLVKKQSGSSIMLQLKLFICYTIVVLDFSLKKPID